MTAYKAHKNFNWFTPACGKQSLRARIASTHFILPCMGQYQALWSTISKPFQNESVSGGEVVLNHE